MYASSEAWGLTLFLFLQFSIYLVSQITNFSVDTLNQLGQSAVGLSLTQIADTDRNNLQQALPSLGQVLGWNYGQVLLIVSNVLSNGYQVRLVFISESTKCSL